MSYDVHSHVPSSRTDSVVGKSKGEAMAEGGFDQEERLAQVECR